MSADDPSRPNGWRRWRLWTAVAIVLLLALFGIRLADIPLPGPLGASERIAEEAGARLTVPDDSAPADASLHVGIQPLEPGEAGRLEELRASDLPGPVLFQVDGELTGRVEVSIPVSEGVEEATLVYFAEEAGLWIPVPTEVVDGRAVASVDHLSSWDVVKGSISDGSSWVAYNTQRVLGNRAAEPICSGGLPRWVSLVKVAEGRNAALLGCGELNADGDSLDLSVVVNRGYAIAFDVPAGTEIPVAATMEMSQLVSSLVARFFGPDRVYIPASSGLQFTLRRPAESVGSIDLAGHVDGLSIVIDGLYVVLKKLPIDARQMIEVYDCVTTTLQRATALGSEEGLLDEALVSTVRACSIEAVIAAVGDANVVRQLNHFFLAVDVIDIGASIMEAAADTARDNRHLQVIVDPLAYQAPGDLTAAPALDAGVASTVMVVVDTSSSMSEDDGSGRIKIEGARAALLDFLDSVEPGTWLGLRTYPDASRHCSPGREVFPVQNRDVDSMAAEIRTLAPDGDTPTAEALLAAAEDLRRAGLSRGVVLLISDGESNCGDPCDAARQIEASGVDVDVISVGFRISGQGEQELTCIANATGGSYVAAGDTDTLTTVVGDLSAPTLKLHVSHPDTVVADVGIGPDGLVTIEANISNDSHVLARNVIAGIRFEVGDSPGIARPTRVLGNLDPQDERIVAWSFKPRLLLAGKTLSFEVYTSADNVREPSVWTSQIGVEDGTSREDAGPVLQEATRIAILGDSYSSGEGSGVYLPDTDTDANACHRSPLTYIANTFDIPTELLIACSGSRIVDILADKSAKNVENGISSQISQLKMAQASGGPVDLVFLTIGGNDVGFSYLANSCIRGLLSCHEAVGLPVGVEDAGAWRDGYIGRLPRYLLMAYDKIDDTLNHPDIVDVRGGRAPIVVLSYPRILPAADRFCPTLSTISQAEIGFIDDFVTQLNGAVEGAVRAAAADGRPIFHVPTTEDAFLPDHTVCDPEPYAVGLEQIVTRAKIFPRARQELLHPNRSGYEALTRAIIRWSLTPEGLAAADLSLPDQPRARVPNAGSTLGGATVSDLLLVPAEEAWQVRPGVTHPLRAAGFAESVPILVTIASEPQVIGVTDSDADGLVETYVTLPGDIEEGRHTITVRGLDSEGEIRALTIPVVVVPGPTWMPPTLTAVALLPLLLGMGLWGAARRKLRDRGGT